MNRTLEELLLDYMDKFQSVHERKETEELLEESAQAKETYDEFKKLKSAINLLPRAKIPRGLVDSILTATKKN